MAVAEGLLERVQAVGRREALDRGRPRGRRPAPRSSRHAAHAPPSTSTVQAPQTPCSQPTCVPVRPRSSRMKSASERRASTTCSTRRVVDGERSAMRSPGRDHAPPQARAAWSRARSVSTAANAAIVRASRGRRSADRRSAPRRGARASRARLEWPAGQPPPRRSRRGPIPRHEGHGRGGRLPRGRRRRPRRASAKSPCRRAISTNCPEPGGCRGTSISVQDLVRLGAVVEQPTKKSAAGSRAPRGPTGRATSSASRTPRAAPRPDRRARGCPRGCPGCGSRRGPRAARASRRGGARARSARPPPGVTSGPKGQPTRSRRPRRARGARRAGR